MPLCDYGCGQEGKIRFKNGKWCCSNSTSSCPNMKENNKQRNKGRVFSEEHRKNLSKANEGKVFSEEHKKNLGKSHSGKLLTDVHKKRISKANKGRVFSKEHREKLKEKKIGTPGYYKGKSLSTSHKKKISKANKGKIFSVEHREKLRKASSYTISYIKENYPLFSKIEEMRYNPEKLENREIQVHCKNHNCRNSKERGGWFTPSKSQIYERIRGIEKIENDGSYFYCSNKCKRECPLYNLRNDPLLISKERPYTDAEYQQFRQYVLKRDNYVCQFCGELATDIHHERPQKLEPFFALDPDYAWSCCEKCHYKYGHKRGTNCNTQNLANKTCN